MSFKEDVCRSTRQEIRWTELQALCRLLTAATSWFGYDCRVDTTQIPWGVVFLPSGVGGPARRLPFVSDPLNPVGVFSPKEWLAICSDESRDLRWLKCIIRAIWQGQIRWTCSKMPRLSWLQEMLNAMAPDTWQVEESADQKRTTIYHIVPSPGRYQRLPVYKFRFGKPTGSDEINQISDGYLACPLNRQQLDRHRLAGRAAFELNRYLPWLILKEGGSIEILPR